MLSFIQRQITKIDIVFLFSMLILCFLQVNTLVDYSALPKTLSILLVATLMLVFTKYKNLFYEKKAINTKNPATYLISFLIILIIGSSYSYNPSDAIYRTLPLISVFCFIYAIRSNMSEIRLFKLLSLFLIIITTSLSLYTIISLLSNENLTHQITYQYRYSFGHRNIFSNFLALSIPIILVGRSYVKQKRLRIAIFISIITSVFCIILLMTRSTYLAISVFLFTLIIGYIYNYLVKKRGIQKRRIIFSGIIIFLTFLSILLFSNSIQTKLENIFSSSYGSSHERIELWKNTLPIIKENPIIGIGTSDWKIEILKYPVKTEQSISGNVYYQRTHNDFLQILSENGLIGLLSYLGFFLLSIIRIINSNRFPFPSKLFLLGGIFSYLTISFFSFPIERIELIFLILIMVYPTFNFEVKAAHIKKILVTPLVVIIVFLVVRIYNDHMLFLAKTKEIKQNSMVANEYYQNINEDFLSIDHTSTPISWYKGNYFFLQNNFQDALKKYKLAIANNPYHPHVLNNIASTYFQLGQNDQAEYYFNKCLEYHPHFNEVIMNYSAFLFNTGQTKKSLELILRMSVNGQHINYNTFYLAIVKKYIYEKYMVQNFYNDNEYLDMSLHCRYHNISIITEIDNRIKQKITNLDSVN